MAINSIKFITSASATATNGSKTITVTGSVDCRNIYSGSAVFLGTRQVVEAVAGTAPNASGVSTITLRNNWLDPNTTGRLVVFNSIEGLAEAIRRAREITAATEVIATELNPLAALETLGFIERTGPGAWQTYQATTLGKALLAAETAAQARQVLGLGNMATATAGTEDNQYRNNAQNDARFAQLAQIQTNAQREMLERIYKKATLRLQFTKNKYQEYEEFGLVDKALTAIINTNRNSNATYDSPFGTATALPNVPRITHDPTTGECLGLLNEGDGINLLKWSQDFTQSPWLKTNGLVVSPTSLQGWVKDTTFTEINDSESGLDRNLRQLITVPNNSSPYVAWGIFKKSDSPVVSCRLALTNGSAVFGAVDYNFDTDTFGSNANITTLRIFLIDGSVLLAWAINNNSSGNNVLDVRFYSRSSTGGVGKVYINVAMVEARATPSSYVKTENGQGNRFAEINVAALNSSLTPRCFYLELPSVQTSQQIFTLNRGAAGATPRVALSQSVFQIVSDTGSVLFNNASLNLPTNVKLKVVVKVVSGKFKLFVNGTLVFSSAATGSVTGLSAATFGRFAWSGAQGNVVISEFTSLPELPDEECLLLSSI